MLQETKVPVDDAKAKYIAQVICKEITTSRGKNKAIYDRAKKRENQYNQITKWMEMEKVCDVPWKGAADYFVPLSEWIVDAIWARLLSILFSQEPYMKARGTDADSYRNQDSATDFVDMIFRDKVKLYENGAYFFKQMIKLPFAVLKYDRQAEFDTQIKQEMATVFVNQAGDRQDVLVESVDGQMQAMQLTANGYQPAGQEPVWTSSDVEIHNGPKLQYVRFDDYVWAPDTKRKAKPYWEGDRCYYTLNDMALKVRHEKFLETSVKRIRENAASSASGIDKIIQQRGTPVECYHWYGRLPFDKNGEVSFEDQEAIEQEVYCCVALKDEELLCIDRWMYNRYPAEERVYLRECFEETENFEGRSMLDKLYKTQQELNDLRNTISNNAWIAMQKIFVKRKTLQGDEYDKPLVFPGAIWEEDQTGDIRMLEVGDVKAIGLELENQLLGFAERISNITNWNLGMPNQEKKTTATEFMGTMQEGNIGREPLLQRCYKLLAKLCEWTIDYYKGMIPPGMERAIEGANGEKMLPSQENIAAYQQKGVEPYWNDEAIQGNFSWAWQGTSLNSDRQFNIAVDNDLMQMYMPHPMIMGNMLAVWGILKKGLVDRGIKNWQDYLPPREAILQEMQMMQQQAQMQQAQGSLPAKVQQKLQERGIPPDQAAQMIKERLPNVRMAQ